MWDNFKLPLKTRWGITSISVGFTYHFPDLHLIYENSVETFGPSYNIYHLHTIHISTSFYSTKMNLFVIKVCT